MTNPWQIYDDLIDAVPSGLKVTDLAVSTWTCVSASNNSAGAVFTSIEGPKVSELPGEAVGKDLRDVCSWIKSWNYLQASIGQCALNCWFNSAERINSYPASKVNSGSNVFDLHMPILPGKKVGMIGHFQAVDQIKAVTELVVLERIPRQDDLPDPACEYELADCEIVYITGETLLNKTLPRLLTLGQNAKVVLVGPSVTFAPEVFGTSVAEFAGVQISKPKKAVEAVKYGGSHSQLKPSFDTFTIDFEDLGSVVETRPEMFPKA